MITVLALLFGFIFLCDLKECKMRHVTLFTMVLAIVNMASIGSAQLLDENFDSLGVGTNMQSVEGWEGWYGDQTVAGLVTDEQA